jgi:amino acid adenylation domain-containing protein
MMNFPKTKNKGFNGVSHSFGQSNSSSGFTTSIMNPASDGLPGDVGEPTPVTQDERTRIIDVWSPGERNPASSSCLHELFETQVEKQAAAVAVVYEGASLNYGKLNERANQLARRLRQLGVGPDVLVGLAVERSLDMAVGLLGILKAGGAYVPLDPNSPKEWLAYAIENASLTLVLTQEWLCERLPASAARLWLLDAHWAEAEALPKTNLESVSAPQNLAYCIYTSGSTGRPKGVALNQAALLNLLHWQKSTLPGGARTLQFASFAFDVSFQEIFSTWNVGGALVIPSESVRRDFRRLLNLLRTEAIDRLYLPTAVLQPLALVRAASGVRLPNLRQIITAGEQLRLTPDVRAWLRAEPQCDLINQYGPTETHVVTSFVATHYADSALPPIGRPIWNTQIHLLDSDLNPVPAGVVGELYVSGAALARGYIGRPELTKERFLDNPCARNSGERLYRTGDLARWRSDGQIEYIGRTDSQVKIRGYRIELGEIEARALEHEGVREAVVVAIEGASGKQLIGYVVPAPGAQDDASSSSFAELIKGHLRALLPEYMVPARFIVLDRMPLTPNGKIDRNALPPPVASLNPETRSKQAADEVEATLASVLRRILKLPYVELDTNFFDLGVNSLDIVVLHEEIRARFASDIPITFLFEHTTIRALAARLANREHGNLALAGIRDRKLRQSEALQRIRQSRASSAK